MYLLCKEIITVLHFNIKMSSKYNFSVMLLGNDVTKALYNFHCEIWSFYSNPLTDNLCIKDKRWISIIPTHCFSSTRTCSITLLLSHLLAVLQLPKCSLISLDAKAWKKPHMWYDKTEQVPLLRNMEGWLGRRKKWKTPAYFPVKCHRCCWQPLCSSWYRITKGICL